MKVRTKTAGLRLTLTVRVRHLSAVLSRRIVSNVFLDNALGLEDDEGPDDLSDSISAASKESKADIDNQGTIPWDIRDKLRGPF